MENLFFSYIQTDVGAIFLIAILTVLTPVLRQRYRANLLRLLWLVLAVRLIIPANPAGMSPIRIEVAFPAALTQTAIKAPQTLADLPETPDSIPADDLPAAGEADSTSFPALHPVQLASGIWMTGFLMLLGAEFARYALWRRRCLRWNRALSAKEKQEADAAAALLSVRRTPRVFVNECVRVPMTVGILRPVLLLPPELLQGNRHENLQAALLHELTHFGRHDTQFRFLVLLARCLHWYNPAAWMLERQFERAIELACDEAVLRLPVSRKIYADTLMTFVRTADSNPALSTAFSSDKHFLRCRFSAVFSRTVKRRGTVFAAAVCAAAVGVSLVACAPAYRSESSSLSAASTGEKTLENMDERESFNDALDGVYTTRKIYAYKYSGHPEDGAVLNSDTGTYTAIRLPELDGQIGVPLCGGVLDGTDLVRLCTNAENGETVFYASNNAGETYAEKRWSVTLPGGSEAKVIEMQNVTENLCLLLATEKTQNRIWLLRCAVDENGLPMQEGMQALPVPIERRARMSFVNEDVGFIVDRYGAQEEKPLSDFASDRYEALDNRYAMPCVLRTTDGGTTWMQMDFSDVLADCPFDGYYACCIFTIGSRTEIRCFTTPGALGCEWIALVSDDFGRTWDWYPRVPNVGTDLLIEKDKAAGLEKILPMIYSEEGRFAGDEAARREYERIVEFIESDGQPSATYDRP